MGCRAVSDKPEFGDMEETQVRWMRAPDGKILCVGVNYRPHAQEMGRDLPPHPLLFVRFPGAQVGHRQSLVKPSLSEQYDYEGELAAADEAAPAEDRGEWGDFMAASEAAVIEEPVEEIVEGEAFQKAPSRLTLALGKTVGGDTYIMFVSWDRDGKLSSRSIHQFGSATLDESSPHFADQTPLFAAMKTKPVLFTEAQLQGHVKRDYRPGE